MSNMKASIDAHIKAISNASKAVFTHLGLASRELLQYVPESNDINAVNRILNVLNRNDRQAAVIFFAEFLPWKHDEKTGIFTGKLSGDRRLSEMAQARENFLKTMIKDADGKTEHEATIWDWTAENVANVERKVDFNNNLINLIQRATAETNKDGTPNKYRISHVDVIADVINSGITLDEMFEVVNQAMTEKKKADDKAAKEAAKEAAKSNVANDDKADKPKRERKPRQIAMAS
jgi:hypothetical protein